MESSASDRRVLLLGVGLLAVSIAACAGVLAWRPGMYFTLIDASSYRGAGVALLHHRGHLYTDAFGTPPEYYLYTPLTAVLFALAGPLPFAVWEGTLTALTLAGTVVVCAAAARLAGVEPYRRRLGVGCAVAAVAVWSEPVQRNISHGQVNVVLAALIVTDLALPATSRWQGAGIGLTAGVKLTPLLFLPYLWLTGRRRAAATGLAVFTAMLVAGFAFLPGASAAYWSGGLLRTDLPTRDIINQSLAGILQRITPDDHAAWLLLAAAVAAAGLALAVAAARRGHRLLGLVLCAETGLLISPISWTDHWVLCLLPALVAVATPTATRRSRSACRVAGGLALVVLFTAWPIRLGRYGSWDHRAPLFDIGLLRLVPHSDGTLEHRWHGWQLIAGNYYIVAGLLALVGAAAYLWITRPRGGADAAIPAARGQADPAVGVLS